MKFVVKDHRRWLASPRTLLAFSHEKHSQGSVLLKARRAQQHRRTQNNTNSWTLASEPQWSSTSGKPGKTLFRPKRLNGGGKNIDRLPRALARTLLVLQGLFCFGSVYIFPEIQFPGRARVSFSRCWRRSNVEDGPLRRCWHALVARVNIGTGGRGRSIFLQHTIAGGV